MDPLQFLFSLEQFGIKFGLDHIRALTAALGHPERAYATIHVAGTNGKGSVTAMVDSILRAAGYRVGRYTSPHLIALNERFVVNGVAVDDDSMRDAVATVRDAIESCHDRGTIDVWPTFFEATTAVAFELFRRANVEFAVCEVGLGGRLDATNVVEPAVAAITSIARDHEQYLGHTLEAIAGEKAGILKPGVPVVVGDLPAEAARVITRRAMAVGAPLIPASERASISAVRTGRSSQTISLRTARRDYGALELPLIGAHQVGNALIAVRIVEEVERTTGRPVGADAVRDGLAHTEWPGRLQRVITADGKELLLDAAHNPEGATALARFLASEGATRPLVFAVMRDKDAAGILAALAPVTSVLIVTRASNPRSAEPEALRDVARAIAPQLPVTLADGAIAALDAAWRLDRSIVAAGSIFLLGDILNALRRS